MSGVQRIDPHDIPHFCYTDGASHNETEGEKFDELEIEGFFGGFLISHVSIFPMRQALC